MIILMALLTATGCSSQKEEQAITTVVNLLFTALQQEHNKHLVIKLAEKNTPAENIFAEENLYIGTLISKEIKSLQANNNNAEVRVRFKFNDAWHSLDQGNHDQNEVIIITLIKTSKAWKISNIEKE